MTMILEAPISIEEVEFTEVVTFTSVKQTARCADGNGTLTPLFFSDENIDIARAKAICDFLKERDVPLMAAALQFPHRHPAVTSVIIGPRNREELEANIENFEHKLPDNLWTELEDAGLIAKLAV